jgi:hypothetical protein
VKADIARASTGAVIARHHAMRFTLLTSLTFLTSARHAARARTILGWTPGLRALVGGRVLPCGCVAGIYETWMKDQVTILDARGHTCSVAGHAENAVL